MSYMNPYKVYTHSRRERKAVALLSSEFIDGTFKYDNNIYCCYGRIIYEYLAPKGRWVTAYYGSCDEWRLSYTSMHVTVIPHKLPNQILDLCTLWGLGSLNGILLHDFLYKTLGINEPV